MTLSRGRDMLAIPGPSIIPDRVLNAMHRPAPNIYEGELVAITGTIIADLGRVARTDGRVAVYIGNGHAAWEAAIANTLAPGDKALVVATGRFGLGWADTARRMGVEVEVVDFGFRAGLDPERIAERLRADRGHAIRAVLAVQVDTASSVRNDIAELRAALDAAGHPGLLMVDCIACLGCDRFEMDALGVDVALAACQKGLMTPPGLAFTFHNAKAEAARVRCPSPYWDWGPRTEPEAYYQLFCGTAPTHHLYGLRCALDIILEEEGLERVWHRHAIFARAIWAAVEACGSAAMPSLRSAPRRATAPGSAAGAPRPPG
jgi:alanine-glyoxylate transaminase/serine-glyoxylate transaminase/serine-pyruvate transaminase